MLLAVSVLLVLYLGSGLLCLCTEGYYHFHFCQVQYGQIYVESIYMTHESIYILLLLDIQLLQHHLWKMLSFLLCKFSFFVKNQVFIGVWTNIQVFDFIPLVNLSIFMLLPCCFHYCSSIVKLDVRNSDVSGKSFIV